MTQSDRKTKTKTKMKKKKKSADTDAFPTIEYIFLHNPCLSSFEVKFWFRKQMFYYKREKDVD